MFLLCVSPIDNTFWGHFLSLPIRYQKMGGWSVFVWVLLLLALLGDSLASAPEFDPYKVLGVSRHASQAEIKKVYKRLAREW